MRHVGRPTARIDAKPLVTGKGGFIEDLAFARELTMKMVRSPVPSGEIRDIDATRARALPGVVALMTAKDVRKLPPIPFRLMADPALDGYRQGLLADKMVRYVGEPVAAVFAESEALADDAVEQLDLDIATDEPVLSLEGSAPDVAVLRKDFGNLNAAFHEADRIIEAQLSLARDGAVPLELRSALARYDAGRDLLEVWAAVRSKDDTADTLAEMLSLDRAGVVAHPVRVGGGFGLRSDLVPEEVLCAFAAYRLGRPVRWREDRREHLVAAPQGRGLTAKMRAAVASDGTLLGLDTDLVIDQGAYLRPASVAVGDTLLALLPGPYRLMAYRGTARMRFTNKPPAGLLRGAGAVEATFLRERLMDRIGSALGVATADVRRRNFIEVTAPTDRAVTLMRHPFAVDSGDFQALVDHATKRFSLDLVRRRVEERRGRGELVGLGSSFALTRSGSEAGQSITLSMDRRGAVVLSAALADFGQGTGSALAQIAADVLGVEIARVRVRETSAERAAAEASGSLMTAGTATLFAAEALRDRLLAAAARRFEVAPETLTIQSGRVRDGDRQFGPSLELAAIVSDMAPGGPLAPADGKGATAVGVAPATPPATPYAVNVVVVEVDKATGIVRVPRAFVAVDVGNAVNPSAVQGQVAGAFVQGLGSALSSALDPDETGTPRVISLADYAMPSLAEAPSVEVLIQEEAESPYNPLGLKGAGEIGIVGVGAAVASAIDDALSAPGFVASLPVRPDCVRAFLRDREARDFSEARQTQERKAASA